MVTLYTQIQITHYIPFSDELLIVSDGTMMTAETREEQHLLTEYTKDIRQHVQLFIHVYNSLSKSYIEPILFLNSK